MLRLRFLRSRLISTKRLMTQLARIARAFARDEEGASMAEYALLLGVITVALITVITMFKDQIANLFNTTSNTLGNAAS